jgi:septum formation protein
MSQKRKIVLASKSPRRKQLLEQIGLEFEISESGYQEDMKAFNNPYDLCKFLALKKAEDVASNYLDAIVIGADTFVVFEGRFIGKPKNINDAKKTLRMLSGKEHEVVTGFAIIDTKGKNIINDFGEARVRFRELSDEEIEEYVNTGEPISMAGSYGLMNKAAVLIENIDGDFYSIVGLPLGKIYVELKKIGVNFFNN